MLAKERQLLALAARAFGLGAPPDGCEVVAQPADLAAKAFLNGHLKRGRPALLKA